MSIRKASVVIGSFKDGGAGIRVAQPGYDADSVPVDNSKLIFSSDWAGSMPIHFVTPVTRVGAGQSVTVSFPALGYIPFAVGLFKFPFDPGFIALFSEYHSSSDGVWRRMDVRDGAVVFANGGVVYPQAGSPTAADFFAVIYRARAFA